MNYKLKRKIFSEIKCEIECFYSLNYNKRFRKIKLTKIIERPFSCVAFWDVYFFNTSKKIVSKKIIHNPINYTITSRENQAVVEFNILKKLHSKFLKIDRCSVPEPLFVLPEHETYLMSYVPGDLLVNQFRNCRYLTPGAHVKELIDNFYNCGKWLNNFQLFTGIHQVEAKTAIKGVIERLEHRLELICKKDDPRIPKWFSDTISKNNEIIVKELKDKEVTVSGRHSDFIPLNIIVNNNGICVIDFLGYGIEPIAVDVSKMMVCLHDEKLSITSSPRTVDQLKTSFLKGYGSPAQQTRLLLYLCEAMQRMVSLWGSISSKNKYIHHKIKKNRCIKSHLDWFSNNLDAPLLWGD